MAAKQRVTLADIAKACDVSVTTVSMALRNKPGIPPETRQRILETAAAMGYRRLGRTPSRSPVRTVGVVVKTHEGENPQDNPFYGQVLLGIEAACRAYRIGMMLSLVFVKEDNRLAEVPVFLEERQVDGVLLVGTLIDQPLLKRLSMFQLPIVLVDAYTTDDGVDAVLTDNRAGAYEAVAHLIRKGHRHIGFIGGEEAYPSLEERRKAYLEALHDFSVERSYIVTALSSRDAAAEATRRLMQTHPHLTAIFACNDERALGAAMALQELGYRIPEDVSLVGFDDIAEARQMVPPLTTVYVDKEGMGQWAIRLLLNRVETPHLPPARVLLRPKLIERQSVAAPRQEQR